MESNLDKPSVVWRDVSTCRSVNVFGIGVDFLLEAGETGGTVSVYLLTVQPGDGSPPHVHRGDDETFYVLSGTFETRCGSQTIACPAGSIVFLPREVPHLFRNVGSTAGQLLGINSPGGHERFFLDASKLGDRPEPAEVAAVCLRNGMEIVPNF